MENTKQPLKIVHVISTLILGGAETFVVNIANEQVKTHEVTILTYKPFNCLKSHEHNLNSDIKRVSILCKKKYSLRLVWQMYKAFKKIRPDVVHIHLHSSLYHVFLVSMFYRKPIYIHTIHSELVFWKKTFQFLSSFSFLNNIVRHICISPKIYTQFKESFPKLKFFLIKNGIYPHQIKRNKIEIEAELTKLLPQNQFLIIANLSKTKNLVLPTRVFKKIWDNHIYANLWIVGEDRDKKLAVTKEIQTIDASNVYLLGARYSAPDYLQVCDALIISSLNEGMPMVALEALSMGKPIISTPAGGMTDIIVDGYNGFITRTFDPQDLYNSILKFIELSNEEKQKMAKNAYRSFIENYYIERTAIEYEEIYRIYSL
jgi:glycosyltransferase involved in cell wall biosynthesis